jgi:hypothetical protein
MGRRLSVLGVWIACAPLLAACSSPEREPISAQTLALTAETNVERALRGAHQAGSFLADSALLAKVLSSTASSSCESAPAAPCADGALCPTPDDTTCEVDAVTVTDLQQSRQEMSDSIDELLESLREEIFTPENLESEDGASAVYLLGPEFFCAAASSAGTPVAPPGGATPTPEPELDSACVERAQRLQPRLRLTSPNDGDVDVALLLTAQKKNPVTLQLHSQSVGVLFDLGELKASLDAIEEPLEGVSALTGQVQIELRKNAELDYSFRVNALTNLALTTLDASNQQVSVSLGKSVPSFEIRLDGNARQLTGSYDLGALGVTGPLNAFRDSFEDPAPTLPGDPAPEKTYTGTIDARLAGLEGSVVFDGDHDKLSFRGLGLGDVSSTLKYDGATLAQLDLNPAAGRHFDLALERTNDEQTTLTFSPTFDLTLLLNFAPLASQISSIPAYLSGDTLRMWFDGTNPSVRGELDQLRVLSGTLNLSSASMPSANIQVPTGNCLLESDAAAPQHELLGQFASGACQ